MRILFLGDIVGRSGRQTVIETLPRLRKDWALDFVIVNGENAAAGFGITAKICDQLFEAGADVISSGNHIWDQKDILSHIDQEKRLLRPLNYPPRTPGRGAGVYRAKNGADVLVINAMGRIFMDPLEDPFGAVESVLDKYPLGASVKAVVIDMHGEATSEKVAMGHFADGRASLVIGTHSHVPTADTQILPGGTAFQTDAGMCGDYNSVIGMDKEEPLRRFTRKIPGGRMSPALGEATLCGVFVETDDQTGLASRIEPVRMGGRLRETAPL